MLHRGVVVSAAVAYLLVLAFIVWPGSAPQAAQAQAGEAAASSTAAVPVSSAALPLRGGAVQIQRVDWIDKYKLSIDRIAEVGGDTVSLVVDTRQENARSTRIYLDMRKTPTVEQLSELIQHAKKKHLRVILMPIVLLDDPGPEDWRGTLKPESWDKWFDSYREMMNHFSWVAQANGVDVLVVGSELVSSEDKLDEWSKTIREIRAVFKGMLTYSSNWDHYTSVHFWDQLDLIGMNSYWKFGEKGKNSSPSVEHIVNRWREIQGDLLPFVRKAGKPLLFLEIGWFSQANVAYEPWDYTKEYEPIDLDLQRKLYEAFFQAWYGNPQLGGFMVWEWPPDDSGPDNRGYTPAGKPAEKVLREWLAKPKWDVKVGRG